MNERISIIALSLSLSLTAFAPVATADSKRIEVYELSQTYVDVRPGDTLGEIAARLLPHNPSLQQKLMNEIMQLNPGAFPGNRAEHMLAGERLFLPNSMQQSDSNERNVTIESFSWGNIKRPR